MEVLNQSRGEGDVQTRESLPESDSNHPDGMEGRQCREKDETDWMSERDNGADRRLDRIGKGR